jgi:hypothetical protein
MIVVVVEDSEPLRKMGPSDNGEVTAVRNQNSIW